MRLLPLGDAALLPCRALAPVQSPPEALENRHSCIEKWLSVGPVSMMTLGLADNHVSFLGRGAIVSKKLFSLGCKRLQGLNIVCHLPVDGGLC